MARRARPDTSPKPRTRLPRGVREGRIVDAAAAFFAEHGFAGRTRDLARRLGVTQALLYRYFRSKQALIDRVFDTVFGDRWDPAWDALLAGRDAPLEARLTRFYQAYAGRSTYVSLRLFVRAGLDGLDFARRYSVPLTERILEPVVRELRHEAGLPELEARPLLRAERELALALHGAVVFLGIRRFVYRMAIADPLEALVALQVRTFLPGARVEIGRLHALAAREGLPAWAPATASSRRGGTSRR